MQIVFSPQVSTAQINRCTGISMCAFTSMWCECESASRGLMTSDRRTSSGFGFYKSLSPERVGFSDTFRLTCDLIFHVFHFPRLLMIISHSFSPVPYLNNFQYCICHSSHRFLSKVPPPLSVLSLVLFHSHQSCHHFSTFPQSFLQLLSHFLP